MRGESESGGDGGSLWHVPCTYGAVMAKRLEDLEVWRLCEEVRGRVVAGIANATSRRDQKFCNQILDAAEDAVADVSEGFARFRPREFAHFLGYAIASTGEVLERTRHGYDRKYFDAATAAQLVVLCTRADRALRSLRRYLWGVDPAKVPYHPDALPRGPRKRRQSLPKNRRGEPS